MNKTHKNKTRKMSKSKLVMMKKETELKNTDPQCPGLISVKVILCVHEVALFCKSVYFKKKWEMQNFEC